MEKTKLEKARDWSKNQPEILNKAIKDIARLNSIFANEEPDKIANVMIEEYNSIINTLAPEKIVNVKKFFFHILQRRCLSLREKLMPN